MTAQHLNGKYMIKMITSNMVIQQFPDWFSKYLCIHYYTGFDENMGEFLTQVSNTVLNSSHVIGSLS